MTAIFRSFRRTLACGAAACLSLLAAAGIAAQNASLSGVAKDATGAVVPAAEITLESQQTGARRTARTGPQGRYSFAQTPPGLYTLTARQEGFAAVVIEGVEVRVNTPVTLPVVFSQLDSVAETVTVEASATQVNTTDASIGNAFGTKPILQLPLEGRNPAGLLSLQPGVAFVSADPLDARFRDGRNGSVNGGRSDQANVTLDGVDVNDQQNRFAFTSVLRNTLDSVQEFRVVTTGANANQGRSSGAQISLVTKSGTNEAHGSLYHFHRNTETAANDFFNNRSGVERPKLIRNVFGGSIGGPIKRNRAFFFFNYEGRRDASDGSAVRTVPSPELRQGIIRYQTADGGIGSVSPDQLRAVDPLGIGVSRPILDLYQDYPQPNDFTIGDGLNTQGFRFNASTPLRWNTYIAKLDWKVDKAGAHTMFLRGNLQNDRASGLPQLPGQEPATVGLNNSKGLAFGYNAVYSPTLVGSFRYGFTRQGLESTGAQTTHINTLLVDSPVPMTRGSSSVIPVHTISQDWTWTHSKHTVQFGAAARVIRNSRSSLENSFHRTVQNSFGLADIGASLDAAAPGLTSGFTLPFRQAAVGLLGAFPQASAQFNFNIDGSTVPVGDPLRRRFGAEEYEFYVQDSWRPVSNLTLNFGLRWSLMPPVEETNGTQVSVLPSLGGFLHTRSRLAEEGIPTREAGRLRSLAIGDPGSLPLYPFHKKNFAPRFSLAYSPSVRSGWLRRLFGEPGKSSIRAGWGMFYDIFGMGIIRFLDSNSPGLSTGLRVSGFHTLETAPRFQGLTQIPEGLIPEPRPGGPGELPDAFGGGVSVDHGIRPPYTMNMNLSFSRELKGGFLIEVGYVGRLSRRSLVQQNVSTFANFRDPASGQRYWDAMAELAPYVLAGAPASRVPAIPFFENLWANAASEGLTATQAVYQKAFLPQGPDFGTALVNLDNFCRPTCSVMGPNIMTQPQTCCLRTLSSIGNGSYHAMQWTLRKRFSEGVQFDLNYTWSKSIDLNSATERGATSAQTGFFGFGSVGNVDAVLVNAFDRRQNRAVSDFDLTHQVNANWVIELPFGKGRRFLSSASPALDALLGGWQVSGLWRHTSGFPISAFNGAAWPTNWSFNGFATPTGSTPQAQTTKNAPGVVGAGGPNVFPDPVAAFNAYGFTLPGQSGQRNGVRGDGLFTIDLGIGKRFQTPWEGHSVQFRAEAFNLTNTVSFNASPNLLSLGNVAGFGQYTSTLVPPRVIQFGLRYEF